MNGILTYLHMFNIENKKKSLEVGRSTVISQMKIHQNDLYRFDNY